MKTLEIYNKLNIEVERANGLYVYSKDGKRYLDTFSGIGVMSFGHCYKPVNDAIKNKLNRFSHISNYFYDTDTEDVSKILVEKSGFTDGRVFYTNSGTEATEAALKAIRKKIGDKKIIYFRNGFHGRTIGSLSINGFSNLRENFGPYPENTVELEFNNSEKFSEYAEFNGINIGAVFFEPVLGSGGVVPLSAEFSDTVENYRKKYNFLVVSDEVQSGLGRTGKFFSYQHYSIKPDIITVAKSIGGGIPLGAVIFNEKTMHFFEKGDHGSTFAPNPLAISAAKYILYNIEKLLPEIQEKGNYFINKLRNLKSQKILEVRGKGLMIGLELKKEDGEIVERALKNDLLINIVRGKTIRLLPYFLISFDEIDVIVKKLEEII
ncbi:MAG: aminotransferase class III-fold pyridoxal phosphate-dependent enzyme [Thermotogae bacterium]|nr:aminotransferase class III-fold pyridoxal phosphate-dependent enzyme [Thermotogota bacterium]